MPSFTGSESYWKKETSISSSPTPLLGANLEVEWLGQVGYAEGVRFQQEALEARRVRGGNDRLLLLEHPPVVTLGRGSREENLLVSREELTRRGIEVHEVSRGGDVTFHSPGQLVGYLVVDLDARGQRDVHLFLRRVESGLIGALRELGLAAGRIPGKTGVFMRVEGNHPGADRKIASIGIGVRHWITHHGFALNVSMDLSGFDVIVPCGLEGVEMTSVEKELGPGQRGQDVPAREAVRRAMLSEFGSG